MKRITFTVDEQFHAQVKAEAAQEGITVRQLCERILREYLEKVWGTESGNKETKIRVEALSVEPAQETYENEFLPWNYRVLLGLIVLFLVASLCLLFLSLFKPELSMALRR